MAGMKKRIHPGSGQGFTLGELLGGMIAAAIFVSGTAAIVVRLLVADRRESARTEVQAEMQAAINFIAADLRQAVYVYNDEWRGGTQFNDPASSATRVGSPDGIPDLNQILRAIPEKMSLIPTGSLTGGDWRRPVLAFWRVENLPANCRPTVRPSPETSQPYRTDRTEAQVKAQNELTRMGVAYELVVYNLKLNRGYHTRTIPPASDSEGRRWWQAGQGRILRQVYRPHIWSNCYRTTTAAATAPAGPGEGQNPMVNTSYVLPQPPEFSRWPFDANGKIMTLLGEDLLGREITPNYERAAGRIREADLGGGGTNGFTNVEVLATFVDAPRTPGPAPACPQGYIVSSNTAMLGFYACVSLRDTRRDPAGSQDVIVHLMGNAWGRAGFDPNTACTLTSDPGYCPVVSRQVFIPAHFRREDR